MVQAESANSRIGWVFHAGHGRYTQFLNFQKNVPSEYVQRSEWIAIPPLPPDRPGKLALLRRVLGYRKHQLRLLESELANHQDWQALFLAAQSVHFLSVVKRIPSYLYVDMTIGQLRAFRPWYDQMLPSGLTSNRILQLLQDRAHRALFRSARGVFAMSEWAASAIRTEYGLPSSRVFVALPGANLREWQFHPRDTERQDPVRILMVGGDFVRKGGPLLLDWARKTTLTGWELDIVTWFDALEPEVRERCHPPSDSRYTVCTPWPEAPHVRLHFGVGTNSQELQHLHRRAHIFCLPTRADGTSNAALEAMATGLPVLVGAVGGIPELIRDGHDGVLVEPGSSSDLESKLEGLLLDAAWRSRLGQAARLRCEEFLNTERQVREIIATMDRG